MNDVITSREELFLAKLAGRDVDIRTMTPPVASSLTEKLMLEIADRLDGMGGGSSETYETIAEIEVEEMTQLEGAYFAETEAPFQTFSESEVYYLNTSDSPNDGFAIDAEDNSVLGILWNCKMMEDSDMPVQLDSSKPYTAILKNDETFAIVADTPDLSNTTVRILKKASAPSGGELPEVTSADNGDVLTVVDGAWNKAAPPTELPSVSSADNGDVLTVVDGAWAESPLPENLKPTYEFAFSAAISGNQITYTPAEGVTYAKIAAALAETPHVKAKITLPEEYGATITADFNFSISGENDVGYAANAVCIIGSNPVAFILSVGENEGQTVCTGLMKTLAVASA